VAAFHYDSDELLGSETEYLEQLDKYLLLREDPIPRRKI